MIITIEKDQIIENLWNPSREIIQGKNVLFTYDSGAHVEDDIAALDGLMSFIENDEQRDHVAELQDMLITWISDNSKS